MAGKLAFLCAQNVNIFAKCHIFHIAAGALPPPSPPAVAPLLPRCCPNCPVCPSSVRPSVLGCPQWATFCLRQAQRRTLPVAAAQLAATAHTHSTTCNGYIVVVGCRKVGNWQLAAPFGLNKSRPRETSFRSRIDLERVSAL